jgi:uncharacterized protein YndB with AHSA1/START domain
MAHTINITKIYDAPIENVFDAWTQPDQLKAWHAPGPLSTPDASVDLSVGGKYHITMQEPGEGEQHTAAGFFKEIEKPNKIVFTWTWVGAPPWAQDSVVTVLLKELEANKTELQLTHELLPDEEQVASHAEGWEGVLDKLDGFLATKV